MPSLETPHPNGVNNEAPALNPEMESPELNTESDEAAAPPEESATEAPAEETEAVDETPAETETNSEELPAGEEAPSEEPEPEEVASPEGPSPEEQEQERLEKIDNLKQEIGAEMDHTPENSESSTENQQPETSIQITSLAKAENRGGGGGGGSNPMEEAQKRLNEQMNKPPLWKRLLLALFGISWERPASRNTEKTGNQNQGGASAQSSINIKLGGSKPERSNQ